MSSFLSSRFLLSAIVLGGLTLAVTLRAQTTDSVANSAVATDSAAVAPASATETTAEEVDGTAELIQQLKACGKTGIALLLASIVGFSFAFERLFNLRKGTIIPSGFAGRVDKLWQAKDFKGILQLCKDQPSTLAKVVREIVEHRHAARVDISTMAGDVASREMRLHLQRVYPLAVVATISPLLGLFGTVYGMMGAFRSVALAGKMGDPSIMASDIAFALVTTAVGLIIAIPALSVFHFFRLRTQILALQLEEQTSHLIERWYGSDEDKSAPLEDEKKA